MSAPIHTPFLSGLCLFLRNRFIVLISRPDEADNVPAHQETAKAQPLNRGRRQCHDDTHIKQGGAVQDDAAGEVSKHASFGSEPASKSPLKAGHQKSSCPQSSRQMALSTARWTCVPFRINWFASVTGEARKREAPGNGKDVHSQSPWR